MSSWDLATLQTLYKQPQFAGLPEPTVLDLTIVQQLLFGYLIALEEKLEVYQERLNFVQREHCVLCTMFENNQGENHA